MYFWNTPALARSLRERRVTARQKMVALLVLMVVFEVSQLSYHLFLERKNSWSGLDSSDALVNPLALLEMAVMIPVTIGGMVWCYRANQRGDGEDFVARFVCLFWPVSIRLFALFFLFTLLLMLGLLLSFGSPALDFIRRTFCIWDVAALIVFEGFFYWRVRKHLLFVSGADAASNPA